MIPWAKFEGREVNYTDIVYNINPFILAHHVDPHSSIRFFAEGHMLYNADERRFVLSQLEHCTNSDFERNHVNTIAKGLNTLTSYIDSHEPYLPSPLQIPTDFGDEDCLAGLTSLTGLENDIATHSLADSLISPEESQVGVTSPSPVQVPQSSPSSSPGGHIAIASLLNHPSSPTSTPRTDLAYQLAKNPIPAQIAISTSNSTDEGSYMSVSTSSHCFDIDYDSFCRLADEQYMPTSKVIINTSNPRSGPPLVRNRAMKLPRMRRSSRQRSKSALVAPAEEHSIVIPKLEPGQPLSTFGRSVKRDVEAMMRAELNEEAERRTMKKMKAEAAVASGQERERQRRAAGAGLVGLGVKIEEGLGMDAVRVQGMSERTLWPQR